MIEILELRSAAVGGLYFFQNLVLRDYFHLEFRFSPDLDDKSILETIGLSQLEISQCGIVACSEGKKLEREDREFGCLSDCF